MNSQLQDYARSELKKGLSQLPESYQMMFKRMYSHNKLGSSINAVVNSMDESKLDWAMQQVSKSLEIQRKKK